MRSLRTYNSVAYILYGIRSVATSLFCLNFKAGKLWYYYYTSEIWVSLQANAFKSENGNKLRWDTFEENEKKNTFAHPKYAPACILQRITK